VSSGARSTALHFGFSLVVASICTLVILSGVVWWKILILTLLWGVSFGLCYRAYWKSAKLDRHELDAWLAGGGDLRITSAIVTGPDSSNLPILTAGPGFERVLGWTSEELEGTPWQTFAHPDDLAATMPEVVELANGKDIHLFANRWRHKEPMPDGETRWIWLEWCATVDEDIGLTYANARDMTARFERETQMATWSRITHDLMAVGDLSIPITQRKFEWVNEAWTRQLGWSPTELYNMRIIEFIDPHVEAQVLHRWNQVERRETGAMECRIRCKTVEGEPEAYRFYEWSTIELNGRIYVTGRDIGSERTHQTEMAKAIADLEARNADLERFASVTAHQLRSPPRTIAGIAQALKEDYAHLLDDEGRQFLEDVRVDADNMAEVVDGLYRFSKVRTTADLNIEPVDLNALLEHLHEQKRKRGCWGDGEDLLWDDLPTVLGDKVLLVEVFTNLIENGFKFNESSPKVVAITSMKRSDGRWDIVVEDNGIGIDPQYQGKLFTMFQRVHPQYSGTGVGLALVAAIINKLGGQVAVKSDISAGATFTFDLEGAWTGEDDDTLTQG